MGIPSEDGMPQIYRLLYICTRVYIVVQWVFFIFKAPVVSIECREPHQRLLIPIAGIPGSPAAILVNLHIMSPINSVDCMRLPVLEKVFWTFFINKFPCVKDNIQQRLLEQGKSLPANKVSDVISRLIYYRQVCIMYQSSVTQYTSALAFDHMESNGTITFGLGPRAKVKFNIVQWDSRYMVSDYGNI